jgi:flagellar biosynthesis/type III secretory pathway M-ring protein FliF/YscJ
MDWLRRILRQAFAAFRDMSAAQRASMVMLGLTIVLTLGIVAFMGARAKYVTLVSGLDQDELSEVVQYLEDAGEEYKIEPSRGAVLVHQDRKPVLIPRLAVGQVVPADKIYGYAEFIADGKGIHISQRHRGELYRIALMGELKRMIEGIEGVESALVNVKQESPSEFGWKPEAVGVAVTVTTKRSRKLDQAMANSIIDLVHSAVRKSDPRKITVVDNRTSRTFRREDPNSVIVKGARRLDLTSAVEEHFRRRIEEFIARAHYDAAVSVSCELDLEQIKKTAYNVLSEELVQVTYERRKLTEVGATGVQGPTGLGPNRPEVATAGATGGARTPMKPRELKEDFTKGAHDYSRVLEEVLGTPGKIKKLNLSVLLFDRRVGKQDAKTGEITEVFEPPTDKDMENWTKLLANQAKIAAEANVEITHMPPHTPGPTALAEAEKSWRDQLAGSWPAVRIGGIFLLATFALFFLYGLGKKAATSRPVMSSLPGTPGAAPEEGLESEVPEPEEAQLHEMQRRIRTFTEQDPRKVAGLVKRWLVREG